MVLSHEKLTELQLELLKSLKHVTTEKQLKDIKALLNLYFQNQLNAAIDKEERERNYTAETYDEWLKNSSKK